MIEKRLQAVPLIIQFPLGDESSFEDVINLVDNKAWQLNTDPDKGPEEIPIPESETPGLKRYVTPSSPGWPSMMTR